VEPCGRRSRITLYLLTTHRMTMSQSLTKVSIVFLLLVALITTAQAQHNDTPNSIGIRIGDPIGVSYKRYLPNNNAFEFVLGGAARGWYDRYYEDSFDHFSRYDGDRYITHRVKSTFTALGRYLFQYNIPMEGPASEGTLDWYWGIGGMLRTAKVRYRYQQEDAPFAIRDDERNDITMGTEAIGGIEYTFEDIPLTLFGEFSLFVEFVDRPGAIKFSGGTGARFNF
jgi:hypothetical protein